MGDIDELEKYALLGNDEYSESGDYLILAASRDYCYSDKFNKAVLKEIKRQVKNYQTNTTIVAREETYTRKYDELIWGE